ncbi:MAG: hypothetical protein H7Z10_14175 [Gemmatimonadaceae bacterium]|nr:hypothetical protein [Acetobacteraceae bacterium]
MPDRGGRSAAPVNRKPSPAYAQPNRLPLIARGLIARAAVVLVRTLLIRAAAILVAVEALAVLGAAAVVTAPAVIVAPRILTAPVVAPRLLLVAAALLVDLTLALLLGLVGLALTRHLVLQQPSDVVQALGGRGARKGQSHRRSHQ